MVVELAHTHFAHRAVFGACGFDNMAGFALVVFLVEDFVVVGVESLDEFLVGLFGDLAGGDWTGFVVDPETDEGQEVGQDYVEVADVAVGHVLEYAQDLVGDESMGVKKCEYPPTAITR